MKTRTRADLARFHKTPSRRAKQQFPPENNGQITCYFLDSEKPYFRSISSLSGGRDTDNHEQNNIATEHSLIG